MRHPLPNMITIVILLLGVSSSTIAYPHPPKHQICESTLGLIHPCLPVHEFSKPTPACCNALAPLGDKLKQMNLCVCFKLLQRAGPLNLTVLGRLFTSCDVSVKLPPVPIPCGFDCAEFVLDGDSTVESYWALREDPSGGQYWQLIFRVSAWAKRQGKENNSSNSTLISDQ